MRRASALLALALTAAACTGGAPRATIQTTIPTTTDTAPAGEESVLTPTTDSGIPDESDDARGGVEYGEPARDRLLISTRDRSIALVDPDGTNELVLHPSEDGLAAYPIWAPNGERVAWSAVSPESEGEVSFSMISANVDGSNRTTMATPFASYYAAYDSSSTVLAVLGNDTIGQGTALAVGLADRDSSAERRDGDAPSYYFTWDTTGPGIIAHARDGVRLLTPGETPRTLDVGRGFYQPPLVTGAPGEIVFGQGSDALGAIQVGNFLSGGVRTLATHQGNAWMLMNPDGNQLAVKTTGRIGEPDPTTDPVVPDDVPFLVQGIDIIDIQSGSVTRVDDDVPIAFFWSPDGEKLLIADFQPLDGISLFQWKLYEGGEVRDVGQPFTPSSDFGGRYLPFFDQYAISIDIWSPDSTRFVYPGHNAAGGDGLWVHDLRTDTAKMIYEGGTFAVWSPT
jgi:hypothetical protein